MMRLKMKLNLPIAESLHYPRYFHQPKEYTTSGQWNHTVIKAYSFSCMPILSFRDKEYSILINVPFHKMSHPGGRLLLQILR